jgi:subtilisin
MGITSIALTKDELSRLKSREGVLAVEEDSKVSALGYVSGAPKADGIVVAQTNLLWNINLVQAPAAWANGYNGKGVNLAILDTGIYIGHPDLTIAGGVSFVQGVTSYNDGYGHGTHCAGIACGKGVMAPSGYNVYGVAPAANLYAVKVLDDTGSGMFSWIIAGMNWCVANKMNVASMSLGSQASPQVAFATAIHNCQNSGVTVVVAAGNSYNTTFPWVCAPANSFVSGDATSSPLAVGAVDASSTIANFSSRGGQTANWNQVCVVAPGVNVYSTYLNNGYTLMSGTSMACPHVAGLAALVCQRYGFPAPQLVIAKICSMATNLGTGPFPNTAYGYGLIDCNAPTR